MVDSIKGTVAVWTWLVELEQLVHSQSTLGGVTRPMECESLVLKKIKHKIKSGSMSKTSHKIKSGSVSKSKHKIRSGSWCVLHLNMKCSIMY